MENDPYPEKLDSKLLFITCEKQCFKVIKDGSDVVGKLSSSQEEADPPSGECYNVLSPFF